MIRRKINGSIKEIQALMDLQIPKLNSDNDIETTSELTLLKPQDITDSDYKGSNHEKGNATWMDHHILKPRPPIVPN